MPDNIETKRQRLIILAEVRCVIFQLIQTSIYTFQFIIHSHSPIWLVSGVAPWCVLLINKDTHIKAPKDEQIVLKYIVINTVYYCTSMYTPTWQYISCAVEESLSNKQIIITVNTTSDWTLNMFQVSLHSMHKYLPRVHILQTTDLETPPEYQASLEHALTYTFPETTFTTVTAYQNQQVGIREKLWKLSNKHSL
jgi:hypothetical protein